MGNILSQIMLRRGACCCTCSICCTSNCTCNCSISYRWVCCESASQFGCSIYMRKYRWFRYVILYLLYTKTMYFWPFPAGIRNMRGDQRTSLIPLRTHSLTLSRFPAWMSFQEMIVLESLICNCHFHQVKKGANLGFPTYSPPAGNMNKTPSASPQTPRFWKRCLPGGSWRNSPNLWGAYPPVV